MADAITATTTTSVHMIISAIPIHTTSALHTAVNDNTAIIADTVKNTSQHRRQCLYISLVPIF
jgi:hypothetical protein